MIKTELDYKLEAIRSLGYLGVIYGDDLTPSGFTDSEIQAEILRLQTEYDAQEYARDRAEAYPSMQDQADMQFHDLINGTTTWQDAIQAVKDAHPKS